MEFNNNNVQSALEQLNETTSAQWGNMGPQHMVEHLIYFVQMSTGKVKAELSVPQEMVEKAKSFILSPTTEFRENTKANFLPDEPQPLQLASLEEAKNNLYKEVDNFFTYFQNNPEAREIHPVFGSLNFGEWKTGHGKHFRHHFKQFGLLTAE